MVIFFYLRTLKLLVLWAFGLQDLHQQPLLPTPSLTPPPATLLLCMRWRILKVSKEGGDKAAVTETLQVAMYEVIIDLRGWRQDQ